MASTALDIYCDLYAMYTHNKHRFTPLGCFSLCEKALTLNFSFSSFLCVSCSLPCAMIS